MSLKKTDRVPVTQGETRRKLLLLLKVNGGSSPSDETSDLVDVGLVDYMTLKE